MSGSTNFQGFMPKLGRYLPLSGGRLKGAGAGRGSIASGIASPSQTWQRTSFSLIKVFALILDMNVPYKITTRRPAGATAGSGGVERVSQKSARHQQFHVLAAVGDPGEEGHRGQGGTRARCGNGVCLGAFRDWHFLHGQARKGELRKIPLAGSAVWGGRLATHGVGCRSGGRQGCQCWLTDRTGAGCGFTLWPVRSGYWNQSTLNRA